MLPILGQTLQRMVLDAEKKEGWTHGHVYVPISRVPRASGCRIVAHRTGAAKHLLRNVVYKEVLDPEDIRDYNLVRRANDAPSPPPPPAPPTSRHVESDQLTLRDEQPSTSQSNSSQTQQQMTHTTPDIRRGRHLGSYRFRPPLRIAILSANQHEPIRSAHVPDSIHSREGMPGANLPLQNFVIRNVPTSHLPQNLAKTLDELKWAKSLYDRQLTQHAWWSRSMNTTQQLLTQYTSTCDVLSRQLAQVTAERNVAEERLRSTEREVARLLEAVVATALEHYQGAAPDLRPSVDITALFGQLGIEHQPVRSAERTVSVEMVCHFTYCLASQPYTRSISAILFHHSPCT